MPAQYIGPLYGPLPDVDPSWAVTLTAENGDTIVAYTPEDMREMIREMQDLRVAHDQLSKLSIAMNSLVDISPRAVANVKADVLKWDELEDGVNSKLEQIPDISPDGLPIIKADVVEYSEVPLQKGTSYMGAALQSVRERMSRLQMKVCRTLDLCAFDLAEAVCCSGGNAIHGGSLRGNVPLFRS